jgi:hypothetical protein
MFMVQPKVFNNFPRVKPIGRPRGGGGADPGVILRGAEDGTSAPEYKGACRRRTYTQTWINSEIGIEPIRIIRS